MEHLPNFRDLVKKENAVKDDDSFNSMAEIYGVLTSEVETFFDLYRIRKDTYIEDNRDILNSLVEIASIAECAAEDMMLVQDLSSNKEDGNEYKILYEELLKKVQEFLKASSIAANIKQKITITDNPLDSSLITLTCCTPQYKNLANLVQDYEQ